MLKQGARRFVKALLSGVTTFASAVKEALVETKPNATLLLNLSAKSCWLIPLLLCPHLFATFPAFYRSFHQQGSTALWIGAVGALAVADAVGLHLRAFKFQVGPLIANTFFWPFLATVISFGAPRGHLGCPASPWFFMCWALALGTLVGLGQRVVKYNGDTGARDLGETRLIVSRCHDLGAMASDLASATPRTAGRN